MIKRRYRGIKPKTVLPKGAVDTQVHMYLPGFPSKSGGPPLPDGMPGPMEYSQVMEWLGIDRIVVTQANAHQKDNRNICALLEEMGEIARACRFYQTHPTRTLHFCKRAFVVRG